MMNPQIAVQKNISIIKKKMGDSPDETAFFRWIVKKKLEKVGFRNVNIIPFDFLHPAIPQNLIKPISKIGVLMELTPFISEFSGSLYLSATK